MLQHCALRPSKHAGSGGAAAPDQGRARAAVAVAITASDQVCTPDQVRARAQDSLTTRQTVVGSTSEPLGP
eukprot:354923-Chlamydomonas_euryale.AAC.4